MGEVVPIQAGVVFKGLRQCLDRARQYSEAGRLAWLHMLIARCELEGWECRTHRLSMSLGMEVYFYPPGTSHQGTEHVLLDHNASLDGEDRVLTLALLLPHMELACALMEEVCRA